MEAIDELGDPGCNKRAFLSIAVAVAIAVVGNVANGATVSTLLGEDGRRHAVRAKVGGSHDEIFLCVSAREQSENASVVMRRNLCGNNEKTMSIEERNLKNQRQRAEYSPLSHDEQSWKRKRRCSCQVERELKFRARAFERFPCHHLPCPLLL